MTDLDLLHFEQLKSEIQAKYIENHTPSFDDISKWKGIDIIYFQEDLRKLAKGNMSEKSFYTYFKNSPVTKLPRIDMLNIFAVYAGYENWYVFKKEHLFVDEILNECQEKDNGIISEVLPEENTEAGNYLPTKENAEKIEAENLDLQNSTSDNQSINKNLTDKSLVDEGNDLQKPNSIKKHLWLGISAVLFVAVGLLSFQDEIFSKEYYYNFYDADRNTMIDAELQVKILKDKESPLLYIAKPNAPFVYTTKSKSLIMVVSSPYYRTDTIRRNLETAPDAENIELKPNDYAFMLFYYSKSLQDLKKKRISLNYLISDKALIYQVYDNETYGVETLDKARYINLVTLPSTSLERLEVIDTRTNKDGKIDIIKFKIAKDETLK